MPGLFNITSRTDGELIDANKYNGDRQEIVNNLEAARIDDTSADLAAMRATADPGEVGSESLATSVAVELQQLRFAVKEAKQTADPLIAQWYATPAGYAGRVYGPCRLDYVNATTLRLSREGGVQMLINGVLRTIPAVGVDAAAGGLTVSTLYYVYAGYDTGTSAIQLLPATAGHSPDPTNGQEVQTSDITRALVGMAYVNASGQFSPTLVASWYNQRLICYQVVDGVARTFNQGPTFIERPGNASRLEFVSWGNRYVRMRVVGPLVYVSGTSGDAAELSVGLDGSAVAGAFGSGVRANIHTNTEWPLAYEDTRGVTEGRHTLTQMFAGLSSGNTLTSPGGRNQTAVWVWS